MTQTKKIHRLRPLYLVAAIVALLGPNAVFLYYSAAEPHLLTQALGNPISLAFVVEACLLTFLFLIHVCLISRSRLKALIYGVLTILGSLAFSLPFFLYQHVRHASSEVSR